MSDSISLKSTNKNLWGGGVEPFKASYGKLMMWFFLISDAFTFEMSSLCLNLKMY